MLGLVLLHSNYVYRNPSYSFSKQMVRYLGNAKQGIKLQVPDSHRKITMDIELEAYSSNSKLTNDVLNELIIRLFTGGISSILLCFFTDESTLINIYSGNSNPKITP